MSLPVGTHVLKDPEAVAREAAERIIVACGETRSERIALCLSGGSTPKVLYGLLAGPDYAARVPWERIHWFFGDDRAVPWDDPRSNVRMVREAFGRGSRIPPTHLHFIPSDAGPEAGARAYERTLLDFYGADSLDPARPLFDLVLLGLGEDGHTASLFPGKPAVDETRRLVVAVPEAGLEPFVPRISLTLPALASSRHVLFLVTGAGKRTPLARLAAGEALPAGRVTSTGAVAWLLDEAAAG
ncbi:6-phosphogluconolactonase [Methylobacterium sp. PvP062]|jgi:6-phosphogluconolactonase|uniref:6-phosphogluconolactonase n=2 Tax=Methylobacterium radiotolerans TaxID=31998 RepID=B1LXU6_METRJ|nr:MULTISPECIES: 6-phosphogluconolactonase [Methylobacterium]MCX7331262.1 6-phosphogluconolactonase [Hyphomicrobiales bacterium]GAN49557.1 6-phosphogluconolactonase [Methylobacterium sp. ME121]ACB24303.1 6-phosphogluconolactonase [Methylobacterium radiotolerans JCM 2831]KIU34062.1 6-phosphogluconolactonase [Methylobacterium radiotolerans]KZC02820.1 6-phosphogluconolactonase [Methylobacterium radiotolerans]